MQQQFSEVFSLEQTQAENERLQLHYQRWIEAANQILRKQRPERKQLIQQLNQLDTAFQTDNNHREITKKKRSTSKKLPPQQVGRSEFSILRPFVFHVITKTQKPSFITDAISYTESLIYTSANPLRLEKHCNDSFSVFPIGELQDSYLYYIHSKTCESSSLMHLAL